MKDLKIGTQLMLGFAAMLVFVIVLGVVSFIQSSQLNLETEAIYNHPLHVRRALGSLDADILSMRLGNRDLMLAVTEKEKQDALQLMELSATDAVKQFELLNASYLGPKSDIDEAYKAFVSWKTAREENTKLALSEEDQKVKDSVKSNGTVGIYRDKMLAKIHVIDDYSIQNANDLYTSSQKLSSSLRVQLILLVVAILLLSILISFYLLRRIRKPILELTDATTRFHNGDMNARSTNESKNEFGILTGSFNVMVESIQMNADLSEKASTLAGSMLIEEDANKFFQTILPALSDHTNSQMAAVYLLSDDKKYFDHFESIGMTDTTKQTFVSNGLEGEFGQVLATHKIQHIKSIPIDTRFIFQTVSGKFIPREIITIPIIVGKEVVAIISLASIRKYSDQSNMLIADIYNTLNARVEGVLAYRKMKEISERMEIQNSELEAQKTEMESQAVELTEQNMELEMQKIQLNEANRLKTNFLSNMSHELRTPLNSVIALSGVLNRRLVKKIPDEEYSYLEVIERNGKHLLTLINDILDISRIEAGREETEISKFNINNLIAEINSMIQPQAEQKNIELIQTAPEVELYITSDAHKCRHILQNLIANALKFTEKGQVVVSVEQKSGTFNITVADTGIGISKNHLPHIFDEFRQADGSTSRKFGGNGLGLAIAKKYANLLGGTISVKSTPDVGSTFKLTLPLCYLDENKIAETATTNGLNFSIKQAPSRYISTKSTASKTILLVEDSEPAIIQLKDFMEESGYKILVAHDGSEALEIIDRTIPDAIILDLMMPGIDGFAVLKTLREAEPTVNIPVLILTAKHITKEDLKILKQSNVHQLIQKGDVNRSELLNAVATMVFPATVETVKPPRELQTIEGKPVVLVVEDNPDNMLTVKAILADNYTILEAVDGNEGLEMVKKHNPNLILMDIALPGMDGIEVFKAIRKNVQLEHIPIIALTASAMNSDRETILAYGFDAYLVKPIDDKLFFKAINEVLYGK